jgi:hypothetical protein
MSSVDHSAKVHRLGRHALERDDVRSGNDRQRAYPFRNPANGPSTGTWKAEAWVFPAVSMCTA